MSLDRTTLTYVVNSLNPGGTEKLVVEMSLAFSAEFNVAVLCLDEPGIWSGALRANGIPVYCLWRQPGFDLSMPFRLATYFRRSKTLIIHAHQCTPWFYSALSRLIYRTPRLLLEEHGRFFPEVKRIKRIIVNRLLVRRLTHAFIAVSRDIRQRLVQFEGLDVKRIDVIYNGVSAQPPLGPELRGELRRKLGFTPNNFVVGTVGRFDRIKNFPLLIHTLRQVCEKEVAVRGLLVGEGPEFNNIRVLVKKLGLYDRVLLTGFRDDARQLIQCMDLFVLSSFSEGTSMALLEATSAGVPVLVTDVGGNPEIVIDGETGWIVPSDSVDELVASMLDSIKNPLKRRRFAVAAQSQFDKLFTFDNMIQNYRQQYHRLRATKI